MFIASNIFEHGLTSPMKKTATIQYFAAISYDFFLSNACDVFIAGVENDRTNTEGTVTSTACHYLQSKN
jgi:hypothetical protein